MTTGTTKSGIYLTRHRGAVYRMFISPGFGADWNPVTLPRVIPLQEPSRSPFANMQ